MVFVSRGGPWFRLKMPLRESQTLGPDRGKERGMGVDQTANPLLSSALFGLVARDRNDIGSPADWIPRGSQRHEWVDKYPNNLQLRSCRGRVLVDFSGRYCVSGQPCTPLIRQQPLGFGAYSSHIRPCTDLSSSSVIRWPVVK